ncbi:MAG: putative exported protein [Bacteroidota bacterium]|jgi:hypothetical protein|nr:putative exported protein [Bacteroidota bacterium]
MLKNTSTLKFFLILFFSVASLSQTLVAQIEVEEEPKRLYYERLRRVDNFWDMKDMRDVTHKDRFLMGKNRISGNITYNTQRIVLDNGQELHNEYRSALGFFTRIRFFEQFSFNTTFYYDFNPKAAAIWTSNYTYSIGRYNWKPYRFNYGYENYINNRYKDNIKEVGDKFLQGYYFLSFSHPLFDTVPKLFRIDESSSFKVTYFARYSIKYMDKFNHLNGGLDNGKFYFGAGMRYTIFKKLYVEGAVYYYPEMSKKQPWDPDYSYGLGYFDWRSFRLSFTYGNWAVNRFPWNKMEYKRYGFLDGNFRITFNWIW